MKEVWKIIEQYSKYEISSRGRIRYVDSKRIKHHYFDGRGYPMLWIGKNISIHRLVALNFLEKPQNSKLEVNHKDGNKENNNSNNLEWMTTKENIQHAWRTGLIQPKAHTPESKVKLSKALRGRVYPDRQKRGVVRCNLCDSEIEKHLSKIDRSELHFCNNKCRGLFTDWPNKKNHFICAECNTLFKRYATQVKNNKKVFCSRECYWKNKKLGGNNASNKD